MKFLIESHIPYIKGLIEPFAEVQYLEPEEFTPQTVADADAIIIRTRTTCNANLLDNSKCQFIGTATIGTDHIDLQYCRDKGIKVCNAAGCNAPAVAQYVLATIAHFLDADKSASPADITIGIVGVGHVGSIVERFAKECGFKTLLCDPPRAIAEGNGKFVDLNQIAQQADIITFHTPLTKHGEHKTMHLCDQDFLNRLAKCKLMINSARGAVISNNDLAEYLKHSNLAVAIDCWEGEPELNPELLKKAFVATPHIAGYSAEGKMRATAMIIKQINKHFNWNITPQAVNCITPTKGANNVTLQRIAESYNPLDDTIALKNSPETFESQRNHYNLRHEVESR